MENLYETIGGKAYNLGLMKPEIAKYISDNLKYDFFDWQREAFQYLLLNEKRTEGKTE